MRNDFESNYLAHWGLKKGAQKEKHKYVARVELPDGKYRYFYTLAEYAAYLKDEAKNAWDHKEEIMEEVEITFKYAGYIDREKLIAEKLHRLEHIKIKGKFDYASITAISTEARQKLITTDPETIAQASRIPGVSPSDVNILLVMMGR